jgi:hypothetical protein
MGKELLELEKVLFKLQQLGLQKGDVLAIVSVWIDTHAPEMIERYEAGGVPVFYYGCPSLLGVSND